ncbi:Uncharacterised protein [[Clostridium] sordellii]|uniref:Membrane protein n=1 Tax=Paraclostridium sordellii TaxID=1505 RepID=A0ABM9RK71_PARSO|nr:hypothetical protein [Paeniclostridium sordellii]EPZ53739.1 putative membrane protein [[Clostridium] sordellii ATCC 9714] [Paeniclostridium sordellii ATCC 9714]CEJ72411.1 putative membrane protein [[Clostridium] sordellii] [Paeniclostridium sordellii]CEN70637.1 Uncharacterised protein [[Clostridium] sordellii] [Paeniclostridium sordellii]CEN73866.1 Uncharacterised protein [[Clostridium] sordellii] [Paeniclostridium sordellii]CEP77155.1 Uncharacterised protein [[Clostridium] sordellii] [Paen
MKNIKNNSLLLRIALMLICVSIISYYVFSNDTQIGVFGKIAILCAPLGISMNIMDFICNICSKKNISKSVLTTLNIVIFFATGFISGIFLI